MSESEITTDVKILNKIYHVAYSVDEKEDLHAAVDLLNEKIRKMREVSTAASSERLVVIAALNIAHEFLVNRRQAKWNMEKLNRQLLSLNEKLSAASLSTRHNCPSPVPEKKILGQLWDVR